MTHDVKRKWIPEVSILHEHWRNTNKGRYDIKCKTVEDAENFAAELETLFKKYGLYPETFAIADRRPPHMNEKDFECVTRREHYETPKKLY